MYSPSLVSALFQYVNTLEEPLQEVNNQIADWAGKIMSGQSGRVSSFTVNGKSFQFADKLSAEEMLQLWTEVKVLVTADDSGGGPITATGINFQITH